MGCTDGLFEVFSFAFRHLYKVNSFYADSMLGKKWKPHYFTVQEESDSPVGSDPSQQFELDEALPKKKSKKKQELSTKGIP